MSAGWMGTSLVCYQTELEAARASCAGTAGCQGVTGEAVPGIGGASNVPVQLATGASVVAVQPCARIDGSFFDAFWLVLVPAVVAVLCAKALQKQFWRHG